ncbi:MAG: hypothetical protein ACKOWL_07935, partial [Sphingobacteriaceae bacterium]
KTSLLAGFVLAAANLCAQTSSGTANPPAKPAENNPTWGIKFSGFVRNDVMYDTRQTVNAREGELLLYPADIANDSQGLDKNATPTFGMLAITSRLSGTITGPDAFGAKTSGIFEAEFFGNGNGAAEIDLFRLRHAYAKLDWEKTQLAFGQYWHPLFSTDCFPGVLSFNTGMPFQPFSRNPQVRLTQKLGKEFSLIVAALSQRDFTSTAPASNTSATDVSRNAAVPNLHGQLQYKGKTWVVGTALDWKSLRPTLTNGSPAVVTKENVSSLAFETYVKLTTKGAIFKAEYVNGQNMTDHLMLGGYVAYNGTAANATYKPTNVTSMWFEIAGTTKKVIPGLFIGYTKNNGAKDANATNAYARATPVSGRGIDHIFRVAPRMEFVSGKFKMGTELELTTAAYGTANTQAKITGATDKVTNTRFLFLTSYSF